MDRIDFRHRAILGAHAALVGKGGGEKLMRPELIAKLAVELGDALVEAMTVEAPADDEIKSYAGTQPA